MVSGSRFLKNTPKPRFGNKHEGAMPLELNIHVKAPCTQTTIERLIGGVLSSDSPRNALASGIVAAASQGAVVDGLADPRRDTFRSSLETCFMQRVNCCSIRAR